MFCCENSLGTSFEIALNITVFGLVLQQNMTIPPQTMKPTAYLPTSWKKVFPKCLGIISVIDSADWNSQKIDGVKKLQRNIERCGLDTFFSTSLNNWHPTATMLETLLMDGSSNI